MSIPWDRMANEDRVIVVVRHDRKPNHAKAHRTYASCSCGWVTWVESWRYDIARRLTQAFNAHKMGARS